MTPESQVIFCKLLTYFHHGDYATFRHICELAYPTYAQDRFFTVNFFMSARLAGLIEVSDTERSTGWWTSFDGDVEIESILPKRIGTTQRWAKNEATNSTPFITDSNGRTLILGNHISVEPRRRPIYGRDFFNRFPRFESIEHEILYKETFRLELGKQIEAFDPVDSSWKDLDQGSLRTGHLVRARKEFSGMTYYVINAELGLLFRVLHPEWAFISALNLLDWPIEFLVKNDRNNVVKLPRAIRLPSPLFRYLFGSSKECKVGSSLEFIEIKPMAWDNLRAYLNPWGIENETKSY